jgi:hypothetical protein
LVFALLCAAPALAETEFYQTVDRNPVGTEETFHLTVVVSDAPQDSSLQVPASPDFEVIQKSTSTQMSYQIVNGKGQIKQVQKYTFLMRANHAGSLTIPAAVLRTPDKALKTEAVQLKAVKGHTNQPQPPPQPRVQAFPGFPNPFDDDNDPFGMGGGPDPTVPRSNSDLFLVAHLDKEEAYVGEQVTLTLTVYSRVELSQIESPKWPDLDGFWNEAIDSPTQLAPEQKVLNGVPYKAYLLKRLALFPVKPGNANIGPIEVSITTGFLFAGGKYKRASQPVALKVKPLPANPGGGKENNVGRWRLSTQVNSTTVALGEPVQVKVTVEGKGNLKNLTLPPLTGPTSLKIYDPQTTDSVNAGKGVLGGKRVNEYIVLPQQSGEFTLPGLTLNFFNPETGKWEQSRTDSVSLTVTTGAGGSTVMPAPGNNVASLDPTQKNQLVASGLKSLHHTAKFERDAPPMFTRAIFVPLAATPMAFGFGMLLLGFIRSSRGGNLDLARRKQARAARARLAAAEKLKASSKVAEFYAEVEKALLSFLEAKLSTPVQGLTKQQLEDLLKSRGVPDAPRARVMAVIEQSELGRFAPGMGGARQKALDDAAFAMETFEVDEERRAA